MNEYDVHLLAAIPNASYVEVHGFGLENFIRYPMQVEEGIVLAPERPGHGVEFDWEKMEYHRVE